MSLKFFATAGLILGGAIGAYVPEIWNASAFSFSSMIGSFVGGLLGIWLGYKIYQSLN